MITITITLIVRDLLEIWKKINENPYYFVIKDTNAIY